MIRRIAVKALPLALFMLPACVSTAPSSPAARPQIAFTFDDLPAHAPLPQGETRVEIGRRIIAALTAENVPAYGFINGVQTEREPDSAPVLQAWRAAGLPLGNHTWSHPNLNDLSVEQYQEEIARNEPMLAALDPKGDWHWFRYPFLSEGDPQKRPAIRGYLAGRGYRIAAVTMSFDDWAYNDPYARCVAKGDTAAIAEMEKDWLDHARASAEASRSMAQSLYGRDIPYVLLMHLGAFDARLLPRLIDLYQDMGFDFVSLPKAEEDPVYRQDVQPTVDPEPSGLEARMRSKGLTPPLAWRSAIDLGAICR